MHVQKKARRVPHSGQVIFSVVGAVQKTETAPGEGAASYGHTAPSLALPRLALPSHGLIAARFCLSSGLFDADPKVLVAEALALAKVRETARAINRLLRWPAPPRKYGSCLFTEKAKGRQSYPGDRLE
jgi:hypothetical protein